MEKNRALNGNGESSNQEDSLTLLLTLKDCCEDGNHEGGLTPLRTTEGNGENGNEEGYLTPQSTMKDDEDLQDRLPENVMIVESNDDGNSEQHTSPSANAGENIDRSMPTLWCFSFLRTAELFKQHHMQIICTCFF